MPINCDAELSEVVAVHFDQFIISLQAFIEIYLPTRHL